MQNWDERAKWTTYYKGEYFYTLTPLPLYYKRRVLLIEHLSHYIKQSSSILDFGCGDGWYINYFREKYKSSNYIFFEGLDVSLEMVSLAQKKNEGINIYQSDNGINLSNRYSLIYSIAVFAHIESESLTSLFNGIYMSLKKGGRFILFEQVAKVKYSGDSFIRREILEYITLLNSTGFSIEQTKLFDFASHRFFERRIAKYFYKYFSRGKDNIEKRLNANKSFVFRLLSNIFISIDRYPIKDADLGFGNVFIVAKKY
jgi:cyclopropane fatty-acyl-phospholipid synthase-like methyltransferase